MFLQKKVIQLPFSKIKSFDLVYNDTADLKTGLVSLCELLKKDAFLIQVFTYERLNEQLRKEGRLIFSHATFNYYLIEDIKICEQFDFEKIRFLNIYSIEQKYISNDLSKMIKHCSFYLGLDNYLEHTEIIINFSYYDYSIISKWRIKH